MDKKIMELIEKSKIVRGYDATNVYATGTKYGPLLSNGIDYLCPDCGGYGFTPDADVCSYCDGKKSIPLDDKRVVGSKPSAEIIEKQ